MEDHKDANEQMLLLLLDHMHSHEGETIDALTLADLQHNLSDATARAELGIEEQHASMVLQAPGGGLAALLVTLVQSGFVDTIAVDDAGAVVADA